VAALAATFGYQNGAVVWRLQKELTLSEDNAKLLFEDLKRFLWVSALVGETVAPPPAIDDAWHVFLLFTMDYAQFCNRFLGCFIHHPPRRPDEPHDGGAAIRRTIGAIENHFGGFKYLSANWLYLGFKTGSCWGEGCTSSDGVPCTPELDQRN
jgi:hypothetical protein